MIFGIIFIFLGILLVVIQIRRMKNEKSEEEKIQEEIEDELLFDPYTGSQITLEEAESGKWNVGEKNNQKSIKKYLNKFSTIEEKEERLAIQYLNSEENYEIRELTEEQIDMLQESAILSKVNNWTYSDAYLYNENCTFILINIHLAISSQIVVLINIDDIKGHYYLREKSSIEKVFDSFRNDDELFLENYESFTIKESSSKIVINKILDCLRGQRELEVEFFNDKLLLKTLKHVNINDLKRLENIANHIC